MEEDWLEEQKQKLDEAYENLQQLEITSTLGNMEKLVSSLYGIRDVYQALCKKGEAHGRAETDS